MKKRFLSTKTYEHTEGLSCVFRQWKADGTHCRFLHGYALKFRFVFGCKALDHRNWSVPFGDLKELKAWLKHMFDHTTVVAKDDPQLALFEIMEKQGLIQLRVLPSVGCERVAEQAFEFASKLLKKKFGNRVWVEYVEVFEHPSNSAIYTVDK